MNPFAKIRTFYKETIAELTKASWPTVGELRESTVVVIIGVAILGCFISVSDFSLSNWVELFTNFLRKS
ncbi:MAG: preprotein translocase subunit SecE [Verrucomicrobiota bacterium]|nr:preprotein translocase subunit SecE [Verrucomicrobiota bacterium]